MTRSRDRPADLHSTYEDTIGDLALSLAGASSAGS
jgi:hypothetical protein